MSQTPFDARSLAQYPLQEVTADFARRCAAMLMIGGRDRYFTALEHIKPRLRTLVLLETLRGGLGRDGLHTYLFLKGGDVAPEVLSALKEAQLDHEADILAEAIAAFGSPYPVKSDVREKLFGCCTSPEFNAFDLRLLAITERFGTTEMFANAIEAYVRRTPWVLERMEQHRGAIDEETRLRWLQLELTRHVDIYAPVERLHSELAALPPDYRLIFVLGIFEREFDKGGMRQFFFNPTGALAPELVEALETLKLERQAALMRKALAVFPAPYERDTRLRRARSFAHDGDPRDKALQDLTDAMEAVKGEPFFPQAVLDFARSRDLIPR